MKNKNCCGQSQQINKERWYWLRTSQKFTQKDTCTDTMKLSATSNVDADLHKSLIDPDNGILKPGAMPQVQTATAAGSKQLLDAISKAQPNYFQYQITVLKVSGPCCCVITFLGFTLSLHHLPVSHHRIMCPHYMV